MVTVNLVGSYRTLNVVTLVLHILYLTWAMFWSGEVLVFVVVGLPYNVHCKNCDSNIASVIYCAHGWLNMWYSRVGHAAGVDNLDCSISCNVCISHLFSFSFSGLTLVFRLVIIWLDVVILLSINRCAIILYQLWVSE